ncbi:MAG: PHP domain-containing protein [Actinomycetota bacterium]|nr:PHP domain-containing protein [Actinomycetota bacterium]MDD5666674.1 PHP domain-containing protein [Actinomycetota bacterium]
MSERYDIKVDLHVHSVASGHAYSTVEECARAAAERGLEAFAVSDHGPAMPGSGTVYHFWNLRVLPRRWHGVVVLRSAEANILDTEGRLDLPDEVLEKLDVVHAGLHPYTGYEGEGVEGNTAALLAALSHPLVDVIVHPDNPSYPVDMERLAEAAAREGKALEVNNSSFVYTRKGSEDNCLRMAALVKGMGGLLAVGSDAHVATFAGEFSRAVEILREIGIAPQSVINYSIERLEDFLASRGKRLNLE